MPCHRRRSQDTPVLLVSEVGPFPLHYLQVEGRTIELDEAGVKKAYCTDSQTMGN